jgi:hypothetical protein
VDSLALFLGGFLVLTLLALRYEEMKLRYDIAHDQFSLILCRSSNIAVIFAMLLGPFRLWIYLLSSRNVTCHCTFLTLTERI